MSNETRAPTITLNNGVKMPVVGLGTFLAEDELVSAAVYAAIKAGYRHIDTAYFYGNHHGVGKGIADAIKDGLISREELFVTTKLWMAQYRPDVVVPSVEEMLQELGLNYVDQILMHWPIVYERHDPASDPEWKTPKDANGHYIIDTTTKLSDTWKELEKCVDNGKTRSIGVSNFKVEDLEGILSNGRIKPVVNQIEVHPYLPQEKMFKFLKSKGIDMVAYSPLGNPSFSPLDGSAKHNVLVHPDIVAIAAAHHKTPANVCIRWGIQRGYVVLPKSIKPERVVENFKVFDFQLTADEMERISAIGRAAKDCHRTFNPAMKADGGGMFDGVDGN